MRKFTCALLCFCAILLSSCANVGKNEFTLLHSEGKNVRKVPNTAEYWDGDVEYELCVSDGVRSLTLDVTRSGGISIGTVSSPAELAGMMVTDDIDGVRIFPAESDEEITMSTEAARGFCVLFGIMERKVTGDEFTDDGAFEFTLDGYDVEMRLDERGYPKDATLVRDGYERLAEFSFHGVP